MSEEARTRPRRSRRPPAVPPAARRGGPERFPRGVESAGRAGRNGGAAGGFRSPIRDGNRRGGRSGRMRPVPARPPGTPSRPLSGRGRRFHPAVHLRRAGSGPVRIRARSASAGPRADPHRHLDRNLRWVRAGPGRGGAGRRPRRRSGFRWRLRRGALRERALPPRDPGSGGSGAVRVGCPVAGSPGGRRPGVGRRGHSARTAERHSPEGEGRPPFQPLPDPALPGLRLPPTSMAAPVRIRDRWRNFRGFRGTGRLIPRGRTVQRRSRRSH